MLQSATSCIKKESGLNPVMVMPISSHSLLKIAHKSKETFSTDEGGASRPRPFGFFISKGPLSPIP